MPRAKLSDPKPRGRMTAYAFFVQTCREEHKKKHPEENVVFSEFSRKCADRWKVMSEKEKQPFHDLADKDKTRYDHEMQGYQGPKRVRGARRRRQRKDPNAPKRALSAFFWFCSTERAKIREANPSYGVGEISKELGAKWANAAPEVKSKCEEMARKDKIRYQEEMEQYRNGGGGQYAQQGGDDHEEMDDDDEEELDDE